METELNAVGDTTVRIVLTKCMQWSTYLEADSRLRGDWIF
jgi:hypothetical protein